MYGGSPSGYNRTMNDNSIPQVQRYYVSRIGKVASAMFDADQGDHFGATRLYDSLDEAQAAFEAQAAPSTYKIIITSPDGTKNVVSREDIMVEFPTLAEAADTAAWIAGVYPHFSFAVEAI